MLIPNHPEDERLAALAGDDGEAGADAALTSHVADCAMCADLVAELGRLRSSLADLPDVAPSRPLRLLPPADDTQQARGDRIGGWVRRVFAPVVTAGAALALVGVVGTAAPAMQGGADSAEPDEGAIQFEAAQSPAAGEGGAADAERDQRLTAESAPPSEGSDTFVTREQPTAEENGDASLPAERSPWPMVLFTGVALVIGALLLRWILVPRAG
jgi:hypothetical protein